jgi:hypothetical protein
MALVKSDHNKTTRARRIGHQPAPFVENNVQPHACERLSVHGLAAETTCPRLRLEGLREIQIDLLKLFGRIERCRGELEEAFGHQPFVRDLPPDCPANIRRFQLYFDESWALTRLLFQALDLWIMSCRMEVY